MLRSRVGNSKPQLTCGRISILLGFFIPTLNIYKNSYGTENIKRLKFFKRKEGKKGDLISEGPKHVLGDTKDVTAATIYRTCFGPSEFELWHFLYFLNESIFVCAAFRLKEVESPK
ncbi:hypothetical protein BpHYR1_033372 [Brachionus plicatilis]|uniref:Uncharacterized protein n=1 Tax=Brachionus plicatilis TaxID=10195 RepID=A0A3M7SQP0_BRAPC|nr:hypothetical protein BpHYR1_033372 [Brachionus plicatilis]